jgi:tetratricopeptide (TPR) repeat protein
MIWAGLGEVYQSQDRWMEAVDSYRKALAIQEAAVGPDSTELAALVNSFAHCLRMAGSNGPAEEQYRRALALLEAKFGPDHPEAATAMANLADLYRATRKHDEALALLDRAIAILRKAGPVTRTRLAEALDQKAAVHASRREFSVADPLFMEALALLRDKPPALLTTRIQSNLAFSYALQRKFGDADKFYRQALSLQEELLGKDNRALAPLLESYGALLRLRKRDAEAGVMLDRARRLRDQATNPARGR